MAEEPVQEIERKWLLSPMGDMTIDDLIKVGFPHDSEVHFTEVAQCYLSAEALFGHVANMHFPLTDPPNDFTVVAVELGDFIWSKRLPLWAYRVVAGIKEGEMRLRSKSNLWGERFFLTIKGKGSLSRNEYEVELPGEVHAALSSLPIKGNTIKKRRYSHTFTIPDDEILAGYTLELDVFDLDSDLKGLILLEIEFRSEEEALAFQLPHWLSAFAPVDVTEDKRYGNASLAVNGLPNTT